MLVVSRKRDEKVIIGDNSIIVTVVEIRGDKVRLGFEAAREIPIHRQEVYEAIKLDNKREEAKQGETGSQV